MKLILAAVAGLFCSQVAVAGIAGEVYFSSYYQGAQAPYHSLTLTNELARSVETAMSNIVAGLDPTKINGRIQLLGTYYPEPIWEFRMFKLFNSTDGPYIELTAPRLSTKHPVEVLSYLSHRQNIEFLAWVFSRPELWRSPDAPMQYLKALEWIERETFTDAYSLRTFYRGELADEIKFLEMGRFPLVYAEELRIIKKFKDAGIDPVPVIHEALRRKQPTEEQQALQSMLAIGYNYDFRGNLRLSPGLKDLIDDLPLPRLGLNEKDLPARVRIASKNFLKAFKAAPGLVADTIYQMQIRTNSQSYREAPVKNLVVREPELAKEVLGLLALLKEARNIKGWVFSDGETLALKEMLHEFKMEFGTLVTDESSLNWFEKVVFWRLHLHESQRICRDLLDGKIER